MAAQHTTLLNYMEANPEGKNGAYLTELRQHSTYATTRSQLDFAFKVIRIGILILGTLASLNSGGLIGTLFTLALVACILVLIAAVRVHFVVLMDAADTLIDRRRSN